MTASHDAHTDVPPADVARRDALPMLADAMLAGPCGVPGAKCPTYLGSTTWAFRSMWSVSGSMGPDGAIYIGGNVDNSFDFNPTQSVDVHGTDGQSDGFLMKLQPSGAYGSTFTIGGNPFHRVQLGAPAVTTTASFVPGNFAGTIDLDPGPGVDTVESIASRSGYFISKFDAAGKYLWGRVLLDSDTGLVYWGGPVATADGGVVLTGFFAGAGDLDPGPAVLPTPSPNGAFVTRLDASGKQLWVRTLTGAGCDSAGMGAAIDSGGVLWLSGTASGTCAFDAAAATPAPAVVSNGFFVASMTLDGKIRTFGSVMGSAELAGPPVVASDGSIYLAGDVRPVGQNAQSTIDLDPSSGVFNRTVPATGLAFVMKLDQSGKLRWLQPIDIDLTTFGSLALTRDDGLMLAGWNFGPNGISIARLDVDGNEVWRITLGGRAVPYSVLVNATGFFLLGGQNGPGDLDPSTGVDFQNGQFVFLSKYAF